MPRKKKYKKRKKTKKRGKYKINGNAKLSTIRLSEISRRKYAKKLKEAI